MESNASALVESLKSANLLPSRVIPDGFTPAIPLSVEFETKTINNGNLVRVSDVKSAPKVSFSSDTSDTYTFMLIDPDAPTPDDPKFAYWRHWVVINIKPDSSVPNTVDTGITLTQYLAPGVKDESAPHRYTYLLFREPAGFKAAKEDVGGEEFVDRRSFKADEWAQKFGLELVGVNWMTGAGDGWKES